MILTTMVTRLAVLYAAWLFTLRQSGKRSATCIHSPAGRTAPIGRSCRSSTRVASTGCVLIVRSQTSIPEVVLYLRRGRLILASSWPQSSWHGGCECQADC
jgi:hypothetical protein